MTDPKKAYRGLEYYFVDSSTPLISIYEGEARSHAEACDLPMITLVEAQAVKELEAKLAEANMAIATLETDIIEARREVFKSRDVIERLREALMVIGSSDFIEGEYYGSFTKYRKMLVDQIADLALKKGDE